MYWNKMSRVAPNYRDAFEPTSWMHFVTRHIRELIIIKYDNRN